MASTEPETTPPVPAEPEATPAPAAEVEKVEEVPPPTTVEKVEEAETPAESAPVDYFGVAEVVLRFLLFASAVVGVVLTVTSEQTKPSGTAKFSYSPALIYLVAAVSVAGLFSLITTLFTFYALLKPGSFPQVLSHFLIVDVILLGIVASATGSAATISYTGLKGNSHLGWGKICDVYDKFCRYTGTSVIVSLFATLVMTILVLLSFYSLSKKIPK